MAVTWLFFLTSIVVMPSLSVAVDADNSSQPVTTDKDDRFPMELDETNATWPELKYRFPLADDVEHLSEHSIVSLGALTISNSHSHQCMGILFSVEGHTVSNTALTSAVCGKRLPRYRKDNQAMFPEAGMPAVGILSVITHPQYNGISLENNLAVVLLQESRDNAVSIAKDPSSTKGGALPENVLVFDWIVRAFSTLARNGSTVACAESSASDKTNVPKGSEGFCVRVTSHDRRQRSLESIGSPAYIQTGRGLELLGIYSHKIVDNAVADTPKNGSHVNLMERRFYVNVASQLPSIKAMIKEARMSPGAGASRQPPSLREREEAKGKERCTVCK